MILRTDRFAHLHLHSIFSIQDGMIPIDKLVKHAKDTGQKAVAITDHGSLGGFFQLYTECQKHEIKPIFGVEAYVNPDRNMFKHREILFKQESKDFVPYLQKSFRRSYHLILLAINKVGYKNILAIQNDAAQNGFYYKPTTDLEFVFDHSEGVVVSSACFAGEISQLLYSGNYGAAIHLVSRFKESFGDRFFIELMQNNFGIQKELNHLLIQLAKETKTPIIITCDSHYFDKEDHELHNAVLNLGSRAGDKSNASWEFETTDLYVKTLDELQEEWYNVHSSDIFTASVFQQGIENIGAIIDMVEPIYLESVPRIPEYVDEFNELKKRSAQGFTEKMNSGMIPEDKKPEYLERLIFELNTIKNMQAISYILLFADVVRFCDNPFDPDLWDGGEIPEDVRETLPEEGVILRGTGRGSVGGSLVAWLLNITQGVDPIRFNLLFERFLDVNRIPKMELGL